MNTRMLMSSSALLYALMAIILLFIPAEVVNLLDIEKSQFTELLLQLLAAFYFSFGFLNWMTKEGKIGGIYNRPIVIANFSHLFIGGLSLCKALYRNPDYPELLLLPTIIFLLLGILFGIILFKSPV